MHSFSYVIIYIYMSLVHGNVRELVIVLEMVLYKPLYYRAIP